MAIAKLRRMNQSRLALLLIVVAVTASSSRSANAECRIKQRWDGRLVGDIRVAASGDRLLISYSGRVLATDLQGTDLGGYDTDARYGDSVVGGDAGFFSVSSYLGRVTVTPLGLDGLPLESPLVLNQFSPDVMNPAMASVARGLVTVTWAQPQAQFATARDIHVALLRDGAVVAKHIIVGREGAYYSVTTPQGDVMWILWREDPYLRLKGVRFSLADGARLDDEPIAIAEDYNDFRVTTVGGTLRLYADGPSGQIDVFELAEDGTVTSRGIFNGRLGRQSLGLPSGQVVHVDWPYDSSELFPRRGSVSLVREEADGAVAPLLQLGSAEARLVRAGGEVLMLSAEDSISGDDNTSRLVLQRLSPTGTLGAQTDVSAFPQQIVDYESCDDDLDEEYPSGCSASGGSGSSYVVLLLAAIFAIRKRAGARGVPSRRSPSERTPPC